MHHAVAYSGRVDGARLDLKNTKAAAGGRFLGMALQAIPRTEKVVPLRGAKTHDSRAIPLAELHLTPRFQQVAETHHIRSDMFCPFCHAVSRGRGYAHPQVTGHPGPVHVSPVLLPGAERNPQVARCPALHKETTSDASCGAATDIRARMGRRII